MRGRAWRRHIEEKVVIKRLRRQTSGQKYWSWIIDANRNYYKKTIVIDYLQSVEYYIAKTMTTKSWDTKHKVKYSPNKNKPYYRDGSKKFSTREMDKNLFVKILKENGIK